MPVRLTDVRTVYEGYMTLMTATLAADDGTAVSREIEHHGHAVAVLPYDAERRTALLVSLPRAPVIWAGGPPALTEAIAGMIDGEDADACVRREAFEEAGVELRELQPVGAAFASPGVSSERLRLYLAPYRARDRTGAGGGLAEEHEMITVHEVSLDALWAQVEAQQIEDMKTLALILALRVRRPDLFPAG